jgi:hypothetical protein
MTMVCMISQSLQQKVEIDHTHKKKVSQIVKSFWEY